MEIAARAARVCAVAAASESGTEAAAAAAAAAGTPSTVCSGFTAGSTGAPTPACTAGAQDVRAAGTGRTTSAACTAGMLGCGSPARSASAALVSEANPRAAPVALAIVNRAVRHSRPRRQRSCAARISSNSPELPPCPSLIVPFKSSILWRTCRCIPESMASQIFTDFSRTAAPSSAASVGAAAVPLTPADPPHGMWRCGLCGLLGMHALAPPPQQCRFSAAAASKSL